jgi:hypothetical protein
MTTMTLEAYWSAGADSGPVRTATAVWPYQPGPSRLSALTEDTLTAEQAATLEERLRNPESFPTREPQPVPIGDGSFLRQAT